DLLPLGRAVDSRATLLGVRGKVVEGGAARYFRRLSPGVFDEADLTARAHELASFVRAATEEYQLDPARIVALGLSNGANIAAGLLLLEPGLLAGAVLLRPMLPLRPQRLPPLGSVPVLLAAGVRDPLVTPQQTEELREALAEAGAEVEVRFSGVGHGVGMQDVEESRRFLAERLGFGAGPS
ncbi:phospholipase/carboxylesterase, partial [mine drainage metagenome]